ncbi:MAG: prolipoprotein diacylglyceryl transferase [Nanoarchaeota archaeon]
MINPVAFHIGSLEIRWYGIIFAMAFFIGILMAAKLARKKNISKETIYDFAVWLIPSSIIGARLGHVLGNIDYYSNNPAEIIAIWHGGVALFGGIFGAALAAILFCRKKKLNFFDLADIFVIPLAFGTIFGRIGNFINQELYGKITSLPWGIYFDNVAGRRHPTQIYEAIGNLIVFLALMFLWKRNAKTGTVFFSYIALYSFIRFFAEFLRDGKIFALGLTLMQLIIIPVFIASAYYIYKINKKTPLS